MTDNNQETGNWQFFPNSDRAKVVREEQLATPKYPWQQVPFGKSFAVPRENVKFKTLRSLASLSGKKLGKKFRVIDHGTGPYEVACLPMLEAEAIQSSSNVVEALQKMEK